MYVEQSGLSIGLNAASAGLNLGMDSMNAYDGLMKEKAKSDMFYAQAQLNANTQEFLRDLEQRNDYENYETYAKQFLTKQKNALQKNIKNNYTAELYSQLFTTAENSLNNTIQTARMQKEYEAIGTQNASAIALNNNTLSGQNAIDANNSIINSEYANGMRNSGYTRAAHLKNASESIAKEWTTAADAKIQNIINNGGDFSEVEKVIDDMALNNEYQVMMLDDKYASPDGLKYAQEHGEGFKDIGNELDKKQIAKELKSTLKTKYNAMVNEMQEKNMGLVTEGYTKLIEMPAEQRISYANAWLRKIDTEMSGNKLSPSQRKQAVDMYKLITDGKAASGTGKDWEKFFTKTIETNMNYYIERVLYGKNTGYDAKGLFEQAVLKDLQEIQPGATLYDLQKQFPVVMTFLDELEKKAPDQIKGILKDTQSVLKDMTNSLKLDETGELSGAFVDLFWDEVNACKYTDDKALKEIATNLKTEINSMRAKELDIVRKNYKTDRLTLEKGLFDEDKKLAEFLNEMEKHPDFVYSDKSGKDRISIFANGDEAIRRGEEWQKEYLKKELGIEPGDILASFEPEEDADKRDVKAVQIFSTADGTKYKVRSSDGKSLNIYTSKDGKNWTPVETKKQEAARKTVESKTDIKEKALSVAKNLDMNILRNAGITNQDWLKNVSTGNTKWLANAISDMVLRYNKSNNYREKENIKKQLEAIGYII